MLISKGDLIFSSKPFVFALFQSEKNFICDQCFKPLRAKISCLKCLRVMFCSRKCQSDSRAQDNHSHECPILASRPLSCMTRITARVIKTLENNSDKTDVEVIGSHRRDWNCLMDHYDDIVRDASVMHEFESIFNDLVLIFGDRLPDIRTVIGIYGKILINSFAVQDELMRQIGRALYLGPSVFDHSCKPTATFLFIGTTIYIKALKSLPIEDITDLRISYIDEFETDYERQRQLRNSYYFQCDCDRCTLNDKPVIDMTEDKSLRRICDTIEQLTHESHYMFGLIESAGGQSRNRLYNSSVQNENNFLLELVSQLRQDVMPLDGILEVKIAEFVAINDKNIELWLKVINIFRTYYGDCHHRLALKLYILAKQLDKQPALKRQLLTEAKTIAYLITPDFNQYATNSNHSRSRAVNRYCDQRVVSDSLINSTLLYLIESELIDQKYLKTYQVSNSYKLRNVESTQRSRSNITVNRNIRLRKYF